MRDEGGYSAMPSAYPVSIKGVVALAGRVLLLRNERAEWELPGGRIELNETPEECVAREIREETGWHVTTGPILDAWMYPVTSPRRPVFIVTYGCYPPEDGTALLRSHEHNDIGLFSEPELLTLAMPDGYRRSIAAWCQQLAVATNSR